MNPQLASLLQEAQRLLQGRQPAAALSLLARALPLSPRDPLANYLSAAAWQEQGDAERAHSCAQVAVAAAPREAAPRYLLAQVLDDLGRKEAAAEALRELLRSHPGHVQAQHYLAMLLVDLGQNAAAQEAFETTLRLSPDHVRAWNNLGSLLLQAGRREAARSAFFEAVRRKPDYAMAQHNLGLVLRDLGDRSGALACLKAARRLEPRRLETALALGELLRLGNELDDAVQTLESALVLERPAEDRVHLSLAFCLAERGDLDAARRRYRQAAARKPASLRAALGEALSLPPIYQTAAELDAVRQHYRAGLQALRERTGEFAAAGATEVLAALTWNNFYLAYQGLDDRELQQEYGGFVRDLIARVAPHLLEAPTATGQPGARLRVGFASSFFTESTVGHYFGRWVTELDPQRFEVYAYHLRPEANPVATAIERQAACYRRLAGQRPAEIAQTIREDQLDVLLYPELGMDSTCFLLAAMRLAPVQAAAWGHPVTSGHGNIDCYFSSEVMEPPGAQGHYCEQLLGLPGIGTNYPAPPVPPKSARLELGLPAAGELLLVPQSLYKIHPDNDALLARILAARPEAKLVLFDGRHPAITRRFRERLEKALHHHRVQGKDRLVFLGYLPRERYLQVNAACDLMLDTLHWSGGNTSLDALSCGLPLVTLPGAFMRGRQSMGMLELAGVPDLIAKDQDDYLAIALRLLADQELRRAVANRLRDGTPQLFDDRRPIAALEEHLLELHARRDRN